MDAKAAAECKDADLGQEPGQPAGGGSRNRRGSRGQTLVVVALVFIGLMGFVGIAVDAGLVYLHRVWLGEAADAAALAAAYELPNENAACARAVEYLENNGYSSGSGFSYRIIFPETAEVDNFPALPSDPNRVLVSPTLNDCMALSISGEHSYIWVSGAQQVNTLLLYLMGIRSVTTEIPAIARQPDRYAMVFSIDHSNTMRSDSCLWDHDEYVLDAGPDFYGVSYACTPQVQQCTDITNPTISYPGWENGLSGWNHTPHASVITDDKHEGTRSVELRQKNNSTPTVYQTISTSAEYLYLSFWVRPRNLATSPQHNQDWDEAFGLRLRWDVDGDGDVDNVAGGGDGAMSPPIVQFCSGEAGELCRFCPVATDYSCPAYYTFHNISDEWQYVVTEIPANAWSPPGANPIEIRFRNYANRDGAGDEDVVYIDEIQLWSCPWKQGPMARYLVGNSHGGITSCGNANQWPNCDTTYNAMGNSYAVPADGPVYTPPDRLFPARYVMQQPLYDVLLSIGKEAVAGEPQSMLEMLGPGHQVGFATFRMYSNLNGGVGGDPAEFQNLTTNYATFRANLFGSVTAMHSSGESGHNLAGGIAAGRSLLASANPDFAPVLVLFVSGVMDTSCGEHTNTYCYDANLCPPLMSNPLYHSCRISAWSWVERQIEHARDQGVIIYPIGLGPKSSFTLNLSSTNNNASLDLQIETLEEIADGTGGEAYYVQAGEDLHVVLDDLLSNMEPAVFLAR